MAGGASSQDIASGTAGTGPELIERAPYTPAALVQDVRVNHRRADVAVAEQLLDGPDVVAGFEQVGCEGMAQRILTLPMNRPQPSFSTVTIRFTASL